MALDCKARALRYLKGRAHSIFEMRAKLSAKKYSVREIDATISDLTSMDLLNDRAFTASFIAARLARSFGFIRIIAELERKGIAPDVIKEQVKAARAAYHADTSVVRVIDTI